MPEPDPDAADLIFWFDFASSYSYLSAMRIETAARDAAVSVRWQPFLLGPIFRAQGWNTSPFNLYPAKGANMWRDMERRCDALGLSLTRPPGFPQNSLRAARIALAACESPLGPAFCRAVFRAGFADACDIADPKTLEWALQEVGLPEQLLTAADDPTSKAELREIGDAAAAKGLFGAPSFTVGDELFWGDDRLDDALAWARAAV
ncbi:MAG: 2-hydroxychromene-2-carboxylate isomerase [Pseudomonadota bacterium]